MILLYIIQFLASLICLIWLITITKSVLWLFQQKSPVQEANICQLSQKLLIFLYIFVTMFSFCLSLSIWTNLFHETSYISNLVKYNKILSKMLKYFCFLLLIYHCLFFANNYAHSVSPETLLQLLEYTYIIDYLIVFSFFNIRTYYQCANIDLI
jgi:hypothetical protein